MGKRPTALGLDPRHIPAHLRRCNGIDTASDEEKAESFRILCERYRAALKKAEVAHAEFNLGTITWDEVLRRKVDPKLDDFFTSVTRSIFASEDPVAALKKRFGSAVRRGRKTKNADRDFELAVRVARHVHNGRNEIDAISDVAEEETAKGCQLSYERVKTIYQANRLAAKAEDELRQREHGC